MYKHMYCVSHNCYKLVTNKSACLKVFKFSDKYSKELTYPSICLFVLFGLNVAFNNLSVISRRCLDVAGSSMLTFIVLLH